MLFHKNVFLNFYPDWLVFTISFVCTLVQASILETDGPTKWGLMPNSNQQNNRKISIGLLWSQQNVHKSEIFCNFYFYS